MKKTALALACSLMFLTSCGVSQPTTPPINPSSNASTVVNDNQNHNEGNNLPGIDQADAGYLPETTLEITKGQEVSHKKATETEYSPVEKSIALEQGDWVKIGTDSAATITWLDDSVTRLSENTELHIEQLTFQPEDPTETNILYSVINGETWNKAIDIVNDKANFSMKGGDVVAGVRGTTVNVRVQNDEVSFKAVEHAIYLNDEAHTTINEGEEAYLIPSSISDGQRSRIGVRKIAAEYLKSNWFAQNVAADRLVGDRIKNRMFASLVLNAKSGTGAAAAEGIALPADPKARALGLLEQSRELLNKAMYALSQNDSTQAKELLHERSALISNIETTIQSISDSNVQAELREKLAVQGKLWLKYAPLLFPQEEEVIEQLKKTSLQSISDETTRSRFSNILKTRDLLHLSDALRQADQNHKNEILKEYQTLIDDVKKEGITSAQCLLLRSGGDSFLITDFQEKCRELLSGNDNTNRSLPQPVSENTEQLFADLLKRAASIGCEQSDAGLILKNILGQKSKLAQDQISQIVTAVQNTKNRCLESLKNQIGSMENQIAMLKDQLSNIPLERRSVTDIAEIKSKIDTLTKGLTALKRIVTSLSSL